MNKQENNFGITFGRQVQDGNAYAVSVFLNGVRFACLTSCGGDAHVFFKLDWSLFKGERCDDSTLKRVT